MESHNGPPASAGLAGEEETVRIILTTSETDPSLQLPEDVRTLFVPTSLRRYGLSRILNSESMLGTDPSSAPVPLDFVLDAGHGDFLRGSLADYLAAEGKNAREAEIQLQYIRALVPPHTETTFEHPDWVASVDILSATSPAARWASSSGSSDGERIVSAASERVLSSSFDGLVRIWNPDGECIATTPGPDAGGHRLPVKAARFLSPHHIASGGMDRRIKIWRYGEDAEGAQGTFKLVMDLLGHLAPITSLEVHGGTRRILTADGAGSIALWTSSKESAPPIPVEEQQTAPKRRKLDAHIAAATRGPLHLRKFHAGPAVVAFDARDSTIGYSGGGTDHCIRTLDLTTSKAVSSITLTADITSILSLAGPMSPLVAAGTAGRRVILIDPREDIGTGSSRTSVLTLKGHTNWVSALAQDPKAGNEHTLASASHDGSVMVWDLRASFNHSSNSSNDAGTTGPVARPVYVIDREHVRGKARPVAGEGIKVFDVRWDETWGIVSGAEDRKVQVDKWR